MKLKNRRLIVYSGLLLPLVAVICCLALMPPERRGPFLVDYGRTLGRVLTGQWDFDELTEPRRRFSRNRRGQQRSSPDAVFRKLDKNDDGVLGSDEVGDRLRASIGEANAEAISMAEFRDAMQSYRFYSSSHGESEGAVTNLEDRQHAPDITVDSLFDSNRVAQIEITIPPGDWEALCSQSRSHDSAFSDPTAKPYTYFRGDIRIDGKLIKDVAIRKKGFLGSQDNVRPAMKVKFAEYVEQDPIAGLDRLTLNNNKQDRALVSQYLTYALFRKAGIPAPRCAFATVTVNGQYLGIYSNVEPVKKPFLKREFGNDEGNLYEGTLTDFYPKSIQWFEAETNKQDNDRSQILALASVLDSGAPTVREISEFVEIGSFLRFWAVESLINFWDGYTQNQNNFFVYQNPSDGLMYFMPWGADSCFTDRRPFRGGGDAESLRATAILPSRLYHNDEIPERYRSVMLDVLLEVWEEQHLLDELDRISELLLDHVDFSQIHALMAMDDVREFIKGRRQQIMAELSDSYWPVEVPQHPRTPLYEDEVGTVVGSLRCSSTKDTSEDDTPTALDMRLDVSLNLEERSVPFESAEVFGLSDIGNDRLARLSFELHANYEGQDVLLMLDTEILSTLQPGVYQIAGRLQDWSEMQAGREIRGEMNLKSVDATRSFLDAEFNLKLKEKRGGHFERRRW